MMQRKGHQIALNFQREMAMVDNSRGHVGNYEVMFQHGHMPDPGAMAYAYMTLSLAPQTINGSGTPVIRQGYSGMARPIPQYLARVTAGIPLTAGQFVMAPLMDDPSLANAGDVQKGAMG